MVDKGKFMGAIAAYIQIEQQLPQMLILKEESK